MATETVTVRMSRTSGDIPWGFRLQGGSEFGTALTIGKVAGNSLADRAGLLEGDYVFQIGPRNAERFQHKEAQDTIVSCGNYLDLIVQRAGSTIWRPSITPIEIPQLSNLAIGDTSFPSQMPPAPYQPPTLPGVKYSLEHEQRPISQIGSEFNTAPKPFSSPSTGYRPPPNQATGYSPGGYTAPAPAPYTPAQAPPPPQPSAYSPRKAASAQEYLDQTGGLFGTDPYLQKQKEEPKYMKSQTLRMIQEENDMRARGVHPEQLQQQDGESVQSDSFRRLTRAVDSDGIIQSDVPKGSPGGVPICEQCGKKIIGVFCKAGGKTLHADCFSCSTCGNSLKNTGYFVVNNKLYCETHARQHQNLFKPSAPIDPDTFYKTPKPDMVHRPAHSPKQTYQPEVLRKGPVSQGAPARGPQQLPGGMDYRNVSSHTTTQAYHTSGSQPTNGVGPSPGANFGSKVGPASQAPWRGRGVLKTIHDGPRVPVCETCRREIRGPFILANSKTWCPDHFMCGNPQCHRKLQDVGFVQEGMNNYCEYCFERYFAPTCANCQRPVTGDCLNALERQWHPECFTCTYCHKPFGNSSFFLEDGKPYCETDWNALFTTKCDSCQFPIEAGDKWVEALGKAFHSNCFTCSTCYKNLEGQSFYAKGGKPYCKVHA